MSETTPRLSLPLVMGSQAQKHITVNEALALVDVWSQCVAQSRTVATQPSSPPDPSLYILPAQATGPAWDHASENDCAVFLNGGWRFLAPLDGFTVQVADEATQIRFDGTQWVSGNNIAPGSLSGQMLDPGTSVSAGLGLGAGHVFDRSLENSLWPLLQPSYTGQSDPRMVLKAATVTWAALRQGTRVWHKGALVAHTMGAMASGTLTCLAGDTLFADGPCAFLAEGDVVPAYSDAGQTFSFRPTRWPSTDVFIGSPFGDAQIEWCVDDPGFTNPQALTVGDGQVGSFTVSQDRTSHIRIRASLPVLVYQAGAGDRAQTALVPDAHEIVLPKASFAALMTTQTGAGQNSSGSDAYWHLDAPGSVIEFGDGAGHGGEVGLPVSMLSRAVLLPHDLTGYQIATIFPGRISVFDTNAARVATHDASAASAATPFTVSAGEATGSGPVLIGGPVLIVGDAPFAVRTNDAAGREYTARGFTPDAGTRFLEPPANSRVLTQGAGGPHMTAHSKSHVEESLSGTTITTGLIIPDRAIVLGVVTEVTAAITGPAHFDVGIAGETSKYGGSLGLAAGSRNSGVTGPTAFYSDTPIVLTAHGGAFTGGSVRVSVHYLTCDFGS